MRVLGIDLGNRRIGLAISDPSATLARPLRTIERGRSDELAVETLSSAFDGLNVEGDIGCVVVGLPTRLDGTPTGQTVRVRRMVALLAARLGIPVVLQDERLSSHEADLRLAEHEHDWRKRKAKLDAAAAAVILQDYLDALRTKHNQAGDTQDAGHGADAGHAEEAGAGQDAGDRQNRQEDE